MSEFAQTLIDWQQHHGRHDLPWQNTRDPYRVWLSEIMLQQTQVETVIPYYLRFLARFPEVSSLAHAPLEEVLALWSGLGYYARARNLHGAAVAVMKNYGGQFPRTAAQLAELPGIGRSTAAAIASFCFNERAAILDGNVKRVLCRHFGIEGFPGERAVDQRLWALAESLLPADADALHIYPQALMDFGATLCTRAKPLCLHCPVNTTCIARDQGRELELPTPKPRKALPTRALHSLLLTSGNAVLLEKRPDSGIWGGLYSLPEVPSDDTAATYTVRRFGVSGLTLIALPSLQHTFTHFRLEMTAWHAPIPEDAARRVTDAVTRWVSLAELEAVGLPAPIRKLLARLSPLAS